MASRAHQQGGAQALPIARAFLAIGGKLMLNHRGQLETGLDLDQLFGPALDVHHARRNLSIGRRFARRLKDPRFARSVSALVAIEGERDPSGWLVMEAAR